MDQDPLLLMQAQCSIFSKAGHKIATYIMEDPDRTISNSIQQMAKDLSISEASIVRFCRTIGLAGFGELKMQLAKYTASLWPIKKQLFICSPFYFVILNISIIFGITKYINTLSTYNNAERW